MNVDELIRATLRRKLACGLAVLLALGAGVFGYFSSTVSYESSAVAIVYPPGAGDIDAKLNPFVNLNDNMSQLAAVTATLLQSPEAAALVEEAGSAPEYTVASTLGDTASALRLSPQLMITTTGTTPEAAQAGAQALLDYSSVALAQLQVQAGVRPNTEASVSAAVLPGPGAVVPSSPLRAAGSYAIAVFIVAMLGIITVGTFLDRRRTSSFSARSLNAGGARVDMSEHRVTTSGEVAEAAERMRRAEPVSASVSARDLPAHLDLSASGRSTPNREAGVNNHKNSVHLKFSDNAISIHESVAQEPASDADGDRAIDTDTGRLEDEPSSTSVSNSEETVTDSTLDTGEPPIAANRDKQKPPKRTYSAVNPRPPRISGVQGFDPFDVPSLQDAEPSAQRTDQSFAQDSFPARKITPVQDVAPEVDDYYGVEESPHAPLRRPERLDAPRPSSARGGPRQW